MRTGDDTGTAGRLRDLVRAAQTISADLDLPAVLRHVVDVAREVIGARYAALGVIAADGHLADFVHAGLPDEVVAGIGRLPQGKGLLGALIDDATPIRLATIGDDARSAGFPPAHPAMESFLGVPVRIRGAVYGNLYLADSTRGGFTAEDEELAGELATVAGAAVHNARRYATARSRQHWLEAGAALTHRILTPSADPDPCTGATDPLQFVAEGSHLLADADIVTVALADRDAGEGCDLRVRVAVGAGSARLVGARIPLEGTLAGQVHRSGEPARVARPRTGYGWETGAARIDVGPVMAVPLTGSRGVHGVLIAVRTAGRPEFTADDVEMAALFANQASAAIDLAEVRNRQARASTTDELERVATDLNDHVIQRLFATGLALQSVVTALDGYASRADAAARITGSIRGLDDTIRQIRTVVFGLQATPPGERDLPVADGPS